MIRDRRMRIDVESLGSIFEKPKHKPTNSRLEKVKEKLRKIDKQIEKLTDEERDLIYEKTRIEIELGIIKR